MIPLLKENALPDVTPTKNGVVPKKIGVSIYPTKSKSKQKRFSLFVLLLKKKKDMNIGQYGEVGQLSKKH